jgi:hypothetical protein
VLREIALGLGGLLVILWAFRDFSRGLPSKEIRYATQYDRYLLGIFVYAGISLIAYFISVMTLLSLYGRVIYAPLNEKWSNVQEPLRAAPWAVVGALIVIVFLPEFPIVRQWTDRVRFFARVLALYPHAFLRLSKLLSTGKFYPKGDPNPALEQKLGRYGAPFFVLDRQFTPSVRDSLLEVQTLRDEFRRLEASKPDRKLRRFFSLDGKTLRLQSVIIRDLSGALLRYAILIKLSS